MKIIIQKYFLPNFISLSSILAGFISIILSGNNSIIFASYMILLGAIFDSLDGMVARKMNANSALGKELDSLADVITFGVAPGYLLYNATLYRFGSIGIIAASSLPILAALRLARFNVDNIKKVFRGLPSTAAGITVAIFQGFYRDYFIPLVYLVFAIAISLLMISNFKYAKFDPKRLNLYIKKNLIIVAIVSVLLILFFRWTIFSLLALYVLSGPFNSIVLNKHIEEIDINS